MESTGHDPLIERFVDMLHADLKRGTPLEASVAEAQRLFTDPAQRQALQAAVEKIKRLTADIEHLRRPSALRRSGRTAWYMGPRDTDDFWPVLRRYLLQTKGWEPTVVESIDTSSTRVISCLDFPGTQRFSTRGLVVGYVQSGKTANFTAVISKAADVGFRVILILSGLTNSLRRQTQERLDRELVELNPRRWQTWTDVNSDIGDFPFNIDAMLNTDLRHLAVVKKNGPRLRRLLRMLKRADRTLLAQCPVLIIDDECDQASVNATGTPDRLTAINRILRDLLAELPRVSYVGYTATPYANVLIDPAYDQDLYPRDFIVALPMPTHYFGAERLFGRDLLDADPVPVNQQGLDMIRTIDDAEIAFLRPPGREQKDTFTLQLTPSLEHAIRYYWLATAAKAVRGLADEHSCMLIHTTVYARSHLNARPVIQEYARGLALGVDRDDPTLMLELERLWDEEQQRLPSALLDRSPVTFAQLRPYLAGSSAVPEVPVENFFSDERLDFSKPARRYIVIGGNVLARGLTIEGLVVSFFLRTASQYDTLMQMGRWFGYREGYEDLPRIWMTADMADYFKDMATVEAEIRLDIEVYERENVTPKDFAIRIRQHPDLAITAPGKMAQAMECHVSYADDHIQTRKFHERDTRWLKNNWDAADALLDRIVDRRDAAIAGPNAVFTEVPFTEVTRFLTEYRAHEAHEQFLPARLNTYIANQNTAEPGSLALWDIAVISTAKGPETEYPLGPLGPVRTVNRARLKIGTDADIKALMSRQDAAVDMPGETLSPGASWEEIKDARAAKFQPGRALLLLYPIFRDSIPHTGSQEREPLGATRDVLGLGIVFPRPKKPVPLGYVRAPIDVSLFEQAEYEEERLPDDEAVG
jgi:Z1 domain-containing protein